VYRLREAVHPQARPEHAREVSARRQKAVPVSVLSEKVRPEKRDGKTRGGPPLRQQGNVNVRRVRQTVHAKVQPDRTHAAARRQSPNVRLFRVR